MFQFIILRERRDLRSSFMTVVLFPFYKFMSLIFRVCALCQNILVYSKERKNLPIKVREDEIRDIPPLPGHYLVDWFSIWEGPKEEEVSKSVISRTTSRNSHQFTPRSLNNQNLPNRFRM
jgi:hypothetical protein